MKSFILSHHVVTILPGSRHSDLCAISPSHTQHNTNTNITPTKIDDVLRLCSWRDGTFQCFCLKLHHLVTQPQATCTYSNTLNKIKTKFRFLVAMAGFQILGTNMKQAATTLGSAETQHCLHRGESAPLHCCGEQRDSTPA